MKIHEIRIKHVEHANRNVKYLTGHLLNLMEPETRSIEFLA